ncbi:unnamed protein product [Pneumocystis jirovecii]|uniref:60S acidic ribosomal protein P2 n=2 Tax=Pneumocystis jirovecii TaxID=42068 RepID=L0PBR1_PNEJI|nr:60S acidic ribosomal protein P2 [Pneumocystis jirovecii RU7]KTW26833.1 60S acidic ribosomal protein P2 [Pneumocystis jirovecii RU7]CCJ29065.1 unnamed protein product [Pneumocystis jirovecii]
MKHLAAYLLLGLGGNSCPTAQDIKKVLESVGLEADDGRLTSLFDKLNGHSIEDLIAQGKEKLASVPSGGAGAAAPASAAAPVSTEEAPAKEEEEEESDEDMGFGLFD